MDVGNPSNFSRIAEIFNNDHEVIRNIILSAECFSDDET